MAISVKKGDIAPPFRVEAHDGQTVDVPGFETDYLVLYFYPKSFTPVCTRQAQGFRDRYDEIRRLGAQVVGVSPDSRKTQCDFADYHTLPFPVLPDPDGALAEAYGVKRFLLGSTKRVTFVLGSGGRVVGRFHHELSAQRHVEDVIALLKS